MLAHANFPRSWFSSMVSFRYFLVFFIFFLVFALWVTNNIFSVNIIFFIDEKRKQWNFNTKVKKFHKTISCFMEWLWNCIAWNLWKKHFTVYPCLKTSSWLSNILDLILILLSYKITWARWLCKISWNIWK